jgi:hypothetical protein
MHLIFVPGILVLCTDTYNRNKLTLRKKYTFTHLRITGFLDFAHHPVLYKTGKHNVSGTGSVSALGWRGRPKNVCLQPQSQEETDVLENITPQDVMKLERVLLLLTGASIEQPIRWFCVLLAASNFMTAVREGLNTKQTLWLSVRDWSTAIGRRIILLTFADRGVSRGQSGENPTAVNISSLDRNRYFFFQVAPHLSSRGWVGPVPDPLLLRKSGSAGNGTQDLCVCSQGVWQLDHWDGSLTDADCENSGYHFVNCASSVNITKPLELGFAPRHYQNSFKISVVSCWQSNIQISHLGHQNANVSA